ncbi:MAG: Gfo/Idh/MocA family oxidoreductase [Lachnospiraceae bacterium]|nr:Gfo/Idh/MocA family oxidoreductase [Lachnospiraceae bacterium]
MRELKIALLGQWHVHGFDFAKKLENIEGCHVAAAADCPQQWAAELSCPLYPDLEAVFEDPSIDGVIVASSIADHRQVLTQAAQAGKHIFVEKAFAVSDEDGEAIRQAVKKSGVHFAISNPVMKAPQMFVRS